jgi:uracil-DNA glycosylase family 4
MTNIDQAAEWAANRQAVTSVFDEQYPFYPMNSPGLPLPGENFINHAIELGDAPPQIEGISQKTKRLTQWGPNLEWLHRRALYDAYFTMPVKTKSGRKQAALVPGHLYGADTSRFEGGPRPARVMIIGKNPGKDEQAARRNLMGPASQILTDAWDEIGIGLERLEYYITNLVRWAPVDDQSDSLPIAHKKDCDLLLQQELRLVRPDFVLCLGSDAAKWLLGTAYGVQAMAGRVQSLIIPINLLGQAPMYHTMQVMVATHPAAVFRTPELYPEFKDQIALFTALTNGAEIGKRETFIDHRNIYKHRQLAEIVDRIRADPDPWRRVIAVDGEWNGEHPQNKNAYLRTIQISSAHGEGYCVVLRHQGGEPAFKPTIGHAIQELNRLLKNDPEAGWFPRVGGHFFRADLPWLINLGLDVRQEYAPATNIVSCREHGGWDTGLMYHAVNETASYRLTDMTVRLTQAPVYDTRLKQGIADYCKQNAIKKEDLEGFGFLPQWLLHPEPTDPEWGDNYAQYDPDVTRRIAMRHLMNGGMLDGDWYGNSSWEPYWRSHRASLGVLEMEMNGICLDKKRVDDLTILFIDVRARLLEYFRQAINWPTFNPDSPPQCVAFLFGDYYSKKFDKVTKRKISIRPPGAMTLDLYPIKSTGKRGKLWDDVRKRGEENAYSPSTDKEVLGILGHHHPLAMMLRDIKFINQVLKGPLRPPLTDAQGQWLRDEEGFCVYGAGLASAAQDNGRVHTHLSQCKETGRGSSARPPLQNISSRREGDYSRIMGTRDHYDKMAKAKKADPSKPDPRYGDYDYILGGPFYNSPIRTIFRAAPGCVLVEADYTGAELAVIAWLANDPTMIEHVRRNALPESDPDFYDMHSNTAVRTFQLSCEPTKKGLKDAGFAPLRVAAKNVNFGIPYGRSAEAIARQCKEEGVEVSEADCQKMIDGYFETYPGTTTFLQECRNRSQGQRWMTGSFGRFRRFIATRDRSVIGEQERQAQNFPIQNTVADAVWQAVYNFHLFRQMNKGYDYLLSLQIHDALLFEVPIPQLRDFLENVLRPCMVDNVPIWPRTLGNLPMDVTEPHYFGLDYDVEVNWGESISEDLAKSLGIDLDLI